MHNRKLRSLAALAAERHRWIREADDAPLDRSVEQRAERPVVTGFIVAITTRRSRGFLTDPREKDISLGNQEGAWLFATRAAAKAALAAGLGINLRSCRIEVLQAIDASRSVEEAA